MVQKIAFFLLAALFALFGYFQLNDPTGSIVWLLMYLGIAGICLMAGLGRIYSWLQLGIMAGLLIGIVVLFPSLITFLTNDDGIGFAQTMSNDYPYIEEARECGGLIISLLAMYFVYSQRDKGQA